MFLDCFTDQLNASYKEKFDFFDAMLGTRYLPQEDAQEWRDLWQSLMKQENHCATQEPYTIVFPPPNVTGRLHMGHALSYGIEDTIARFKRLQGKKVSWIIGVDHAGIATQMMVKKHLESQGKDASEMGREAFLQEVWRWKEEHQEAILNQMRELGLAFDGENIRFTLEPQLSASVQQAFLQLYREGLIYRDTRMVHWDPLLRTALSDLEVYHKESHGTLWHIAYSHADDPERTLVVATTRPETLFGDVALAVHPEDPRYLDWIGAFVRIPLQNKVIPVIADPHVSREQGTGVLKITPAHDFDDYAIGKRHGLTPVTILTEDGRCNEEVMAPFRGMDRFAARKAVLHSLREQGRLIAETPHTHRVPYGERSGVVIEPRLTLQWFVRMETLAEKALHAVREGAVKLIPEHWTAVYEQWLEKIEPWCISRQLWWGHRIPVWYDPEGKPFAASTEEEAQQQAGPGVPLVQDPDVLETWFSSALWPFSTLGWPGSDAHEHPVDCFSDVESQQSGPQNLHGFDPSQKIVESNLESKTQNQTCFLDLQIEKTSLNQDLNPCLEQTASLLSSQIQDEKSTASPALASRLAFRSEQTHSCFHLTDHNQAAPSGFILNDPNTQINKRASFLNQHYPADLLVTGFDILFFWVARMVMMGSHLCRQAPFRHVLIHPLVRDPKGQKMSKTKGNVVDPIEIARQYGADSLRWCLLSRMSGGQDLRFDLRAAEGSQRFVTKVWNAVRFCLSKDLSDIWRSSETSDHLHESHHRSDVEPIPHGIGDLPKERMPMEESLHLLNIDGVSPVLTKEQLASDASGFKDRPSSQRTQGEAMDLTFGSLVQHQDDPIDVFKRDKNTGSMDLNLKYLEIPAATHPINQWILAECEVLVQDVTEALENYSFTHATENLYHFVWHIWCDWYLEWSKVLLNPETPSFFGCDTATVMRETKETMGSILETLLRLLHPFLPYVTETLWHALPWNQNRHQSLLQTQWPHVVPQDERDKKRQDVSRCCQIVIALRRDPQIRSWSVFVPHPQEAWWSTYAPWITHIQPMSWEKLREPMEEKPHLQMDGISLWENKASPS